MCFKVATVILPLVVSSIAQLQLDVYDVDDGYPSVRANPKTGKSVGYNTGQGGKINAHGKYRHPMWGRLNTAAEQSLSGDVEVDDLDLNSRVDGSGSELGINSMTEKPIGRNTGFRGLTGEVGIYGYPIGSGFNTLTDQLLDFCWYVSKRRQLWLSRQGRFCSSFMRHPRGFFAVE
jgi:hypothetical protein